ncbi:MAG: hypothetical protein IKQ01_03650 [Bacteroidales bacterium]|nr:hypothetical protein [Bacteroidales bacterium]
MMWRWMWILLGVWVVMFWNVECLFDPFDDPMKNDDEFTAGALRHWTWSRFEKKRDGIAQTIMAVADQTGELPALVGLAEVENRMVVSQLVRKTLLEELGYGYVHRESPDERGIDVALLYRKDCFRPLTVDSLRIPGHVTRDILYVKMRRLSRIGTHAEDLSHRTPVPAQVVNDTIGAAPSVSPVSGSSVSETSVVPVSDSLISPVNGSSVIPGSDRESVHVFVVHFPSKRGGAKASDGRRAAALGVLERAVDSLLRIDPASCILVMGDFNEAAVTVAGLAAPPFAAPPFAAPLAVPSTAVATSTPAQSAAPGTIKYHGRWEQIDHFFVSPSMEGHMQIFAPPFLLEDDPAYLGTKPRRTYVGPRYHGGLSDHLPIIFKAGD